MRGAVPRMREPALPPRLARVRRPAAREAHVLVLHQARPGEAFPAAALDGGYGRRRAVVAERVREPAARGVERMRRDQVVHHAAHRLGHGDAHHRARHQREGAVDERLAEQAQRGRERRHVGVRRAAAKRAPRLREEGADLLGGEGEERVETQVARGSRAGAPRSTQPAAPLEAPRPARLVTPHGADASGRTAASRPSSRNGSPIASGGGAPRRRSRARARPCGTARRRVRARWWGPPRS